MSEEASQSPEIQVFCDEEGFSSIRDNPEFHRVMTLARIVNSIRFVEVAIVTRGTPETPSATRQTSGAFFYLAALLFEGLNFADRLGEYFKDSSTFRNCFVPLLKDPQVRELRSGLLSQLRNQAVYHHDDAVIPAGLKLIREKEYVFTSMQGPSRREVYYDLADIAVMHFGLETPQTTSEFAEQTAAVFQSVTRVAVQFAHCADELIREYILATGWHGRVVSGGDSDPAA